MCRSGKFSWWRLTCILLVLAGLMHVPVASAVGETSPGDDESAIVMPAAVHDEIPLAANGEQVRVVRPERLVERIVEPIAVLPRLRMPALNGSDRPMRAKADAPLRPSPLGRLVGVVELRL